MIRSFTIYAIGLSALAAGIAGYKIRDWQCNAAVAKAYEKADKLRQEMQDEVEQSERDYETARAATDGLRESRSTTIERIYSEIPAPPVDCAAPDSISRLLQGGIDSANASATGKP